MLTERRDESVDLGELLERLRAMLVQGLGAGQARSRRRSSPVTLGGDRATALALVFTELFQNALEHGGERCGSSSPSGTATSCSRSPTTAAGSTARRSGTGLSIVEALVRDELGGTLSLTDDGGLRAEVVFPA